MLKTVLAAAAAAALVALAPATLADGAPNIEKIEAKLFYEYSATLSKNVADGSGVSLWNSMIGEGDIEEPANDVLIIVTVSGEPGTLLEVPLTIAVTQKQGGKTVASRKVESILIPAEGKASAAVYVQDTICKPLSIKATLGKSAKTSGVPFACGE